ncbi:MAG: hypothetical protein C4540_02495 [Candidatus Omnitrophota bacterium]|nr:MAG: hypothetical protein C4540_02495 [Candidatus Omnitrophota bacterium]
MLSQSETDLYRSLKKTAIVLMLMIRLDKPVGQGELAAILDIDPRTAERHLRSLAQRQLITRTHIQAGYILTQTGRQLVLGVEDLPPVQAPFQPVLPPQAEAPRAQNVPDEICTKCTDLNLQNADLSTKCTDLGAQCVHTSESVVVNLTDLSLNTSSTDLSAQNVQISPAALLCSTRELFGQAVIERGLEHIEPRLALGWIAQAYDCRARLRFPPGLIYKSLLAGRIPRREYVERPQDYLPDWYLAEIGLAPETVAEPERLQPLQVEEKSGMADQSGDESIRIKIPGRDITAMQAWNSVQEQLQMEMPRHAYDAWVRDAHLVRFDIAIDTLVIRAGSEYAHRWIVSRLESRIRRLLVGICARQMQVKFIW